MKAKLMEREKVNEVITYYHVKDSFTHWNYYYKISTFVSYLGALKSSHLHQTRVAANNTLESGIIQSWGLSSLPDVIQRHLKKEPLGDEKVVEITKEEFDKVYEKVLEDLNNVNWNWEY